MNKKLTVFLLSSIVLMPANAENTTVNNPDFDDLHKLTAEKLEVDNLPKSKLSNRAFEALMEQMYPTTTDQLKKIQQKEREFNHVLYDNKQPSALTDIIHVSTKPGAKPVEIFVASHHTSTLNLIDATGQPWPITSVMFGNNADYKIAKVEGHAYANIIRINPEREVGTTNVNLSLVDLPTTITVTMKNNTDKYHPSPILQIDKNGPHAKVSPIFSIANINSDKILKNIVLGIAPTEFERLTSSDKNVEAWRHNGNLYIRTVYQPSSPLPRGIHYGPGNYASYRLNDIPVLVMTSSDGYEKKITLEENAN